MLTYTDVHSYNKTIIDALKGLQKLFFMSYIVPKTTPEDFESFKEYKDMLSVVLKDRESICNLVNACGTKRCKKYCHMCYTVGTQSRLIGNMLQTNKKLGERK